LDAAGTATSAGAAATPNQESPVRRVPVIVATLQVALGIGPLVSQRIPWPCDTAVREQARHRCLVNHIAVAESALSTLRRMAAAAAPAALDSLRSSEFALPRAWDSLPALARSLLTARFRLEVLRHHLDRRASMADSTVAGITPVEATFERDPSGDGLVMVILTYSSAVTMPTIALYSPLRDERRVVRIFLRTYPVRFGVAQGWRFYPGDMVEVRQAAFHPRLHLAW
jgi:hypothetical protein